MEKNIENYLKQPVLDIDWKVGDFAMTKYAGRCEVVEVTHSSVSVKLPSGCRMSFLKAHNREIYKC